MAMRELGILKLLTCTREALPADARRELGLVVARAAEYFPTFGAELHALVDELARMADDMHRPRADGPFSCPVVRLQVVPAPHPVLELALAQPFMHGRPVGKALIVDPDRFKDGDLAIHIPADAVVPAWLRAQFGAGSSKIGHLHPCRQTRRAGEDRIRVFAASHERTMRCAEFAEGDCSAVFLDVSFPRVGPPAWRNRFRDGQWLAQALHGVALAPAGADPASTTDHASARKGTARPADPAR